MYVEVIASWRWYFCETVYYCDCPSTPCYSSLLFRPCFTPTHYLVVQLVEQWTCNQEVLSSTPTGRVAV